MAKKIISRTTNTTKLVFVIIFLVSISFFQSQAALTSWGDYKVGNPIKVGGQDFTVKSLDGNKNISSVTSADGKTYERSSTVERINNQTSMVFNCTSCGDNPQALLFSQQNDGGWIYNSSSLSSGRIATGDEIKQLKSYQATTAKKTIVDINQDRKNQQAEVSCGWTDIWCALAKLVYYVTIKPASFLLWLSGYLFDFVFNLTVVNLSSTLGKTGTVGGFYPVIKEVWAIFRDLINMTFIFVLLYAAINTILRTDTSGMKKTISSVIMAAILINFSLFFTEVIIDVSNNFAVTIYNQITQLAGGSISAAFAQKLGLETIMGMGSPGSNTSGTIITVSIIGSIFLLVLAVVFFVVSILFIVRFVMFIILMMMSPVGIGGSVVPKLQEKLGGKFWDDLISQCFFAPIFMLFLWIILKILNAATMIGGNRVGTIPLDVGISTGGKAILPFMLSFIVIVALLIKALEVSKSMSASGAEKFQKTALKWGGTAALGSAGFIGRNTVGRAANRMAEKMKERGDLDKAGWRGGLARMSYKASKKTAESSFDVRSSSIGKMVTENAGLDLGKGKDGGYKAQLEEWKKREEAEHKDYTMQTAKEKAGVEGKDKEASNKALLAAEKEINDPAHAAAKAKAEADEAALEAATVAHNAAVKSGAPKSVIEAAKTKKEVATSESNLSKKAFENSSKKMVESLKGLDFKVDSAGLEEFMKKTNKEIAAKKSAGDKQDKEFIELARVNATSTKDMLRTLHEDSKKELEVLKKSGERRGQSFERQTRLNPFISNGAKTEVRQSMRKTRKEKSPRELLEDALKANNMTPAAITTPPPSTP